MRVLERGGWVVSAVRSVAAIEWVCLLLGGFLTLHYAWLLDDAYVYFRYADNCIILRRGLVFNPGEYVEGFSSPAWMALLLVTRLTSVSFWVLVRVLGVLLFAVTWGLLVWLNRRAMRHFSPTPVVNFPLIHLCLTYGVLSYFTSGMETPLVQLIAVSYALLLIGPPRAAVQVLVGLSPMVRHELVLPFLLVLGWLTYQRRSVPWVMVAAAFLSGTAWLLFRVWYYADVVPNTFYLKDIVWWKQGMLYVLDTAIPYGLSIIAASFLAIYAYLQRRHGAAALAVSGRLVMLLLAAAVTVYVVKIGGDPRHYRYLAFPYCLGVCATAGLAERFLADIGLARRRAGIAVLVAVLAVVTVTRRPAQLLAHPLFGACGHRQIQLINDAELHRRTAMYTPQTAAEAAASELRPRMQRWLAASEPDVTSSVRVTWKCSEAYRAFDAHVVHSLGLTDPLLARCSVPSDRPGHKFGLLPFAHDIAAVRARFGHGPGRFHAAVSANAAPPWIAEHLDLIKAIERRMYNQHNLWDNVLAIAQPPGRIAP